MFALLTAVPGDASGGVLVASLIAWPDLVLIAAGVLLIVLARVVVYRKRHHDDAPIPLIDMPTPVAPGQPPRPAWPADAPIERHVAERAAAPADGPDADYLQHGQEVRAGVVRFHRPPEGTLQLLPGRLEIVSGKEGVDEIRFVKVPGKEPVITFGRSSGEPHTHVELQSPTVSRNHATMQFHKGSWHIANLSKTNPVVVRGKQLAVQDPPVRLEDGDQVEMGEVTFRFHTR